MTGELTAISPGGVSLMHRGILLHSNYKDIGLEKVVREGGRPPAH
jgi:hypothetical protein